MFIDPLRSGSALRQECHVDITKPLLARPRSNRLMFNHLYFGANMALLAEGEKTPLLFEAINISLLAEGEEHHYSSKL